MELIFTPFRFLKNILLASLVFISIDSVAAVRTSVQSGNWGDAITWGGAIPAAADDVVIGTGTTVNLNVNTPDLASIIVQSGGNLTVNANNSILNVSGNVTNDGTIDFWQSETLQADVILQANSIWSGVGAWNLSGIGLQVYGLEFGSAITLSINRSITSGTNGKLNSIAKRSDIIFNFKGTADAVIPSATNDFYYGSISLNKADGIRNLTFSNSTESNNINLSGDLSLTSVNDRLYIGLWNVLAINNELSGSGYIVGDGAIDGPSITIGGTGPAVVLNIQSANSGGIFRDFKITRPGGVTINSPSTNQVAFRFNFTIDNSTVTIGNNVLLKVGSILSSTELGGIPSGNLSLLNGGRFIGGANASFDLSGNSALAELRFDESTQLNQTLKDLTLTKPAGRGELKSNLTVEGQLNITDNNNLSIGSGTLTLKELNFNTSGELSGSANSNLAITGTGIPARVIRFNQATSANRTLKTYSQTRNVTIILANRLDITDRVDISGNGAILASAGNLNLLSTSTTNANVGPLSGGAAITGNVTVESFLKGGVRGYQTLSSPVYDAVNTGQTVKAFTFGQLKNYMLVTGNGTGFDQGAAANPTGSTIKLYNEPVKAAQNQFFYPGNIADTLSSGKGFYFFFRGDRTNAATTKINPVNGLYAVPQDVTMKYTGQINQGNIAQNLSYTNNSETSDGFNLIGNPYPSTINWDTGITKTNTANKIWALKKSGSYAVYDGVIGVNQGSQYILPGQGFFVKAVAAGAKILFTEASKTTIAPVDRLLTNPKDRLLAGTTPLQQTNQVPPHVRLTIEQDTLYSDETVIAFKAGSSANMTEEDAVYFGGDHVLLSSISADNKYLAINYMPDTLETSEVKLYVQATASGGYSLNLGDYSTLKRYEVLLQDNYLNQITDLISRPVYPFSIDKTITGSFGSNRFKLLFKRLPEPVNLTNFTARKTNEGAELKWTTGTEPEDIYFELEQSSDGIAFKKIGQAEGKGASTVYAFMDKNPANGMNYYRLKQVDANGKFTVSETTELNYTLEDNNSGKFDLSVYPNPATTEIYINLPGIKKKVALRIFNMQGKKVKETEINSDDEVSQNITELTPGVYILEVSFADNRELIGWAKFIKQ